MKARLLAVAFAAMVAACGTVAGPGGFDPSPTPMTGVTITTASNQHSVTAHVGDHIQIALGEDVNWQLEPPDGTVRPRGEPQLPARARDAGNLARAVRGTIDDQGDRRKELPERRGVSAAPRRLQRDRRGDSVGARDSKVSGRTTSSRGD